jgi:hypothetical protein
MVVVFPSRLFALQVVCEQEEGFPPRLKLADLEEGDVLVNTCYFDQM